MIIAEERVKEDTRKMLLWHKHQRESNKKMNRHMSYHWYIAIPKPKWVKETIQEWLLKRKYNIPKCCSVMSNGSDGPYRYCSLAIFKMDEYSQRHPLTCPTNCSKCGEFHHDYRERDKK